MSTAQILFLRPLLPEERVALLALELAPGAVLEADSTGAVERLSWWQPLATELEDRQGLLTQLLPWARRRHLPFYYPRLEAQRPLTHIAFDLDGTLSPSELMVDLAERVGCAEQMQRLTEAAVVGAVPFAQSFLERTELLRGLSLTELRAVAAEAPLADGAVQLLARLTQTGRSLCLVTGAYEPLAELLGQRLGIALGAASGVLLEGDKLLGLDEARLVDAAAKAQYLAHWAGAALLTTLAVGDGANDIHMLSRAGHALHYSCSEGSTHSLIHLFDRLDTLTHIL